MIARLKLRNGSVSVVVYPITKLEITLHKDQWLARLMLAVVPKAE